MIRKHSHLLLLLLIVPNVFALQNSSLTISVFDVNSALIPNVTIRIKQNNRLIKENLLEETREISFSAGKYVLEAEAPGFKPYSQEIEIKPGKNHVQIQLDILEVVESVSITQNPQEKALDNAFSNFLSRDQIEALPDEPGEMGAALRNMAGDPNAIIRVDGFTGGNIPQKTQIASIRIVRSSFDAEYHQIGNTYIDITTRASASRFSGSASFSFYDEALGARNPLSIRRLPEQSGSSLLYLSGPLKKNVASFSIYAYRSYNYEGKVINAVLPGGALNASADSIRKSTAAVAAVNYNLPQGHTAKFTYSFSDLSSENLGVGEFNLPERGFNLGNVNHQFRISESGYIGKSFLNEIRLQYTDETVRTDPLNNDPAIIVLDAFSAGGAGNRNFSRRQNALLADNFLFSVGKYQSLKVGGLLEYEKRKSELAINENGTFTFSRLSDYLSGRAATFTQSTGARNVSFSQIQVGAYVQDEIRVSKSFMVSAGLRYEWQDNLKISNNFSPRLGFTWSPSKKGATVIRGGAGIYYNWLETSNLANILSQDYSQPGATIIVNPGYARPLSDGLIRVLPQSYSQLAPNIKNPYVFLSLLGVERRLSKTTMLRATYKYQKGVHQFRSRDINAPLPGSFLRPDAAFGRITQAESSAFSLENSFNLSLTGSLSNTVSYAVNYNLAKNISDSNGFFGMPSDNYNLRLDRSVSNLDQRHRIYSSVYWKVRNGVNLSTNFILNSPLPYNITTGTDDNGDTIFNDRPLGILRNSGRGTWQKQVDTSLSWTFGLFKRKAGENKAAGRFITTSSEAASGDVGIDPNYRYSIKLYTTATNVFNQANFTNFVGVQASPLFSQPVTAVSPRRIEFGTRFSF